MQNKFFFAINTGALENSVFHNLINPQRQKTVPSENREVTFAKSPAGFCSVLF